jgi:hypothetical protein
MSYPTKLKRVNPGDPITAKAFNELISAIEESQIICGVNGGLTTHAGPGGRVLALTKGPVFFAQLSAPNGNAYGWQEKTPDTNNPGQFIDGFRSSDNMKNPAYNTVVGIMLPTKPFPIVELTLGLDGHYWFTAGSC